MKKNRKIKILFIISTLLIMTVSIFNINRIDYKQEGKINSTEFNYSNLVDKVEDKTSTDPVKQTNGIFVSNSGIDSSGRGTEAQPYKTIEYAISNAVPGQTIYLRAGTYNELVKFTISGQENNPITLRNYPNEEVTITANGIEEADAIVDLNENSYINLIGLKLDGIQEVYDWSAYGILLRGGNKNCIISECEITNVKSNGINGNASGITLWGETENSISNVLIQNNYIHDCQLGWSEGIAVTGNCEYIDIIGNTIENITNIGIDIQGNYGVCSNPALDFARYVLVSQNRTSGCISSVHQSAGLYVDGASNVIIERNISHDNTLGIEVGAENPVSNDSYYPTNNLVINNLVYNNTATGIRTGGFAEDTGKNFNTKIYNNTVIHPSTAEDVALCIQIGDGYDITNNIIVDLGTWNYLVGSSDFDSSLVKNVQFNNNLLYHANAADIGAYMQVAGTAYTTSQFNSASFASNNILEQNPNLTIEYKLQDSSPAVAKGLYTSEIVSYLDLEGKTRTSIVDMGCYAYTQATQVDKTLLKEKIDEANSLRETDYSSDSWQNLQDELARANTVYNNDKATQDEVDKATEDLQAAIDALTTDKTELKNTIDSVENYTEEDYEEDSWKDVETALDEANTVYNNDTAKQSEIDSAKDKLQQALDNLVAKAKIGSITIICHEQQNGDTTTNPPLKGIEYTLYKVDETCEDEWDANDYINENSIVGIAKVTDDDGKITYNNLGIGRYYAKVTKVPDGVNNYENFLIDIPMTNMQGTGLEYDVVVEPKIKTAYGNLELTKVDKNGMPLEGVKFKVQAKRRVRPMGIDELPSNEWIDYIPEGASEVLTVVTDENGKINLNNLPDYCDELTYVYYRLMEVSASSGYIKNDNIISNLYFYVDENGKIITSYYGFAGEGTLSEYNKQFITNVVEGENLTTITYMNEKPTITKKVKNSIGNFIDSAGFGINSIVTFKLTADVPLQIADMSTYKITDALPEGLILDRTSIKVEGTTDSGSEVVSTDMYTLSSTGLELIFDTSKMYDIVATTKDPIYNSIIVTYNTTFDSTKAVIGGAGNVNTAVLEYTNNIDEDGTELSTTTISDTAEAHTGVLKIEKVEKGNLTNKLSGAKFKIATSEANAKAGIFVTDGVADIEVTTDTNGQAEIKGLAYADNGADTSYWLVETQAPRYTETVDGVEVERTYNLLKNPVEVKVGKATHNTAVQVQNSKGIDLPATGGIGIVIFTTLGIGMMAIAIVYNKKQNIQE